MTVELLDVFYLNIGDKLFQLTILPDLFSELALFHKVHCIAGFSQSRHSLIRFATQFRSGLPEPIEFRAFP